MRNIYESRHYKLFILIPVALLLVSLYFIPKIQLDSSLRGGITVQVQTNSSPDIRSLTAEIDSAIPGAQASVSRSPGGLSVSLVENASLTSAEAYLTGVYSSYSNYSQYELNLTQYSPLLRSQPGNATVARLVNESAAGAHASASQLQSDLKNELDALRPMLGSAPAYNASDYPSLVGVGQSAYSNASAIYKNHVVGELHKAMPFVTYSYNEVTPTLGSFFLGKIKNIIIVSFVLVAFAVFFLFRTPVPSFAIVFGATNDILIALGAMGLFGIPLGLASVGGLLMLLGYSIDTDMLSAIRVLKRTDSTPEGRAFSSMKTGMTMTLTAIISFSILLVVSYVAFIPTYYEISAVVLVGLIADLATTWLANLPIILWYKKRKEVRR